MKHITKVLAAGIAITMGVGLAAGCGSTSADPDKGHAYFLNSKAEVVDQLQQLADDYTAETGVQVDVQTASSGSYESTLTSELAKSEAPTMFTIAGYDEFAKYQQYLEPLQDTEVYGLLNDEGKSNSHKVGDDSYTLPYAAEWYGIIYNKKIIKDYCSKDYAVIGSDADITDYATLKKVAEDIQKHKDDLGIQAAFATPGLDSSDSYRFAAHMTRMPLFYEYRDLNTTFTTDLKGTYLSNYKDLFDLELSNSPSEKSMVSSKTYDDVTSEFALGDVAFYPNGVWAYTQIKDNNVADEDLGMLPYWMGIDGEEDYGPAGVYDASWAVNKNASEKDKQATLDFIKWMVSNDDAKKILAKDMGFSVPFTTFEDESFQPDNPLTKSALKLESDGLTPIHGAYIPGQAWADGVANALLEYAQGTGDWNGVKKAYLDDWTSAWDDYESNFGMLPPVHK